MRGEVEEFGYGYRYGDYSGVVLYGPPTKGFWFDRLAVSNIYIRPLFLGILDRAEREIGAEKVPRLASEWNALEGWKDGGGPVPIAVSDAAEFAEALSELVPSDLTGHCAGCTAEECLRCAEVICEFIGSRLARGVSLFIEND